MYCMTGNVVIHYSSFLPYYESRNPKHGTSCGGENCEKWGPDLLQFCQGYPKH